MRPSLPRTLYLASDLDVSNIQAKKWLQRLVAEGVIEKYTNPVRFWAEVSNASWSRLI